MKDILPITMTEGLSLIWGIILIAASTLILTVPSLRNTALNRLKSKVDRNIIAGLCFLVAIFHLGYYQAAYNGTDAVLIAIGYVSAIKGLFFLKFPSMVAITEKTLFSKYISGWILIAFGIGLYLLNQAFHFIT